MMVDVKKHVISIIGLGYVGLPMAVVFSEHYSVIAFDINVRRIEELKKGKDFTGEVTDKELLKANIEFTSNITDLKRANFHIIAVPTPINEAKQPDLTCLLKASETVGQQLNQGDIIVYESTVYPGATEEECIPMLEKVSGLKAGKDFFVGYSPERINPGDKKHTFKTIKKIVSAQTPEVLELVANIYNSVIDAGVHRVSSIKTAEAAKVIENTQRDINIALINELAAIFNEMQINTLEVLEAAGTKWNFLPFRPGLVGGHCIGVDPYYLTYKAKAMGLHPEVILAGRRINDNMGKYIAEQTIKHLVRYNGKVNGGNIAILGFAFKENCSDVRNTRVIDIYRELKEYSCNVFICDPMVDPVEIKKRYSIDLIPWRNIPACETIIVAVAHKEFKSIPPDQMMQKLNGANLLVDVKSILDHKTYKKLGAKIWQL